MSGQCVGATCPVRTLMCLSSEEARVGESQIRAYKLGKQRWSYNQYELLLMPEDTQAPSKQSLPLTVTQAVLIKDEADSQPGSSSKISYRAHLSNGTYVITSLYLVYSEPSSTLAQESCDTATAAQTTEYSWTLVTRDDCKKGCKGPLLHPLRRLGVLGSRFIGPSARKADNSGSKQYKQSKYMYFAIDEACTHVGSKTFRLIAAVHNETGSKLLGTTCSQPIRVVANNDIPQGAAHISLVATISGVWGDRQPSDLRRPNISLWPNSRLQQTSSDTQCDVSVCYSARLQPNITDSCCPEAAEVPLQSGICAADYRSTNTRKSQLRSVTGGMESSGGGNEGLPCTEPQSEASLDNHDDPFTEPDVPMAQPTSEGAHRHFVRTVAELSEMGKQGHEARFDPVDTMLWELESEPLPPSPISPRDTDPIGSQSGGHPFNSDESLCGEYSDLQNQAPGLVVEWDCDVRGQAQEGDVQITSELPFSQHWCSQQHSSTHGVSNDSHLQSMLGMTISSLKRARCMHPATADCGSGLRSSSLSSDSAPNELSSPWRKCMRRGFLFPAATSYSEHFRSATGACAPEERQASVRSLMGTCIAQLEDRLETQTNELRQQRVVTSALEAQHVSQQQEIQWLRDRVCQLQHGQYIRKSIAARTST